VLAKTLAFRSYKKVVRLRNSALKVCKRVKQNLLSFLPVHGFSYSDGKHWTMRFSSWLKTVHFESEYLTYCFEEYLSILSGAGCIATKLQRQAHVNLRALHGG
jgi:hypothetical protein